MTATVLSTAQLPIDLAPLLGELGYWAPLAKLGRAELLAKLGKVRALISLLDVEVDEELLDAAPDLLVVANYAVGLDNVDVAAATKRGVVVTNTPDVLTEATADLAFALLMAAARRLGEGERLVRSGGWEGWAPRLLVGQPIHGQCIGVIGAGRIGCAMLRRAKGFGMSLLYSGPSRRAFADALGARHVAMEELLAESDFVSLHCPLQEGTRHLMNTEAFVGMKPSAILVNTARGGCVDTEALTHALANGYIAGAGLDVFEQEPVLPASLLACEKVVLSPHVGSATVQARGDMARICADAVVSVLGGRLPTTAINPEVMN